MNDLSNAKFDNLLASLFTESREFSLALCKPLEIEDYGLQAMAETSPVKWHLAHTSWFYETFVLKPFAHHYQEFHPLYHHLFNSYYNGVGQPFKRPNRGLLSRPTVQKVLEYRLYIDQAIQALLEQLASHFTKRQQEQIKQRIQLGIQHEKQHQELMLTDLKYNFFQNPLLPEYQHKANELIHADISPATPTNIDDYTWRRLKEGLVAIGHNDDSFCFDNETPNHLSCIPAAEIANELVSNAHYQAFIEDGGYQNADLWLSDGWDWVNTHHQQHPLYWIKDNAEYYEFTLYGKQRLNLSAPVCHVSFYEADAFARWSGCRLPTEFEWEGYAKSMTGQHAQEADLNTEQNNLKQPIYHPNSCRQNSLFQQVWQWTQSSYAPYPGFQPAQGAIGEYNGKFMCNQIVLRGGSCFTPVAQSRTTYRNFFYPESCWQMTGIRLAKQH